MTSTGIYLAVESATAGVSLNLVADGNISVNTGAFASSVNIQSPSGSITGSGIIAAPGVSLSSNLGGISVNTYTSNLTVSSTSGNVSVNNTSPILTLVGNSLGQTLTVANNSDISVLGNVSAASLQLSTPQSFVSLPDPTSDLLEY